MRVIAYARRTEGRRFHRHWLRWPHLQRRCTASCSLGRLRCALLSTSFTRLMPPLSHTTFTPNHKPLSLSPSLPLSVSPSLPLSLSPSLPLPPSVHLSPSLPPCALNNIQGSQSDPTILCTVGTGLQALDSQPSSALPCARSMRCGRRSWAPTRSHSTCITGPHQGGTEGHAGGLGS